jgi:ornithine decarboxylase
MVRCGANMDCASKGEIRKALELGIPREKILYANPCKKDDHLEYARNNGINLMTFDCSEEAENIAKIHPNAELILRIVVANTDAPNPMSKKFGAPPDHWSPILDTCKRLKMRVRGVSFHVGTGGCSFSAYGDSIKNCKFVFELAKKKGMAEMDILDIGGGFSMCAENPNNNFDK